MEEVVQIFYIFCETPEQSKQSFPRYLPIHYLSYLLSFFFETKQNHDVSFQVELVLRKDLWIFAFITKHHLNIQASLVTTLPPSVKLMVQYYCSDHKKLEFAVRAITFSPGKLKNIL